MLIGEYQHTIDAKGRMIVPAKFREDLGFTFIVTRGLDGCLYGYPLEQWELIQNKLRDLPQSKKDARAFTRFMNSAAIEVEFDKQGRVNISQTLREYAGLEKIAVSSGTMIVLRFGTKNVGKNILLKLKRILKNWPNI